MNLLNQESVVKKPVHTLSPPVSGMLPLVPIPLSLIP